MYLTYLDAMMTEACKEFGAEISLNDTQHSVLLFHHMSRTHPGMDRSEILLKLMNYSSRRHNAELYYRQIPFDRPAFKKKDLMHNFQEIEGVKYLTETDIEEQKAKHLRQAKALQYHVDTLEVNAEANE